MMDFQSEPVSTTLTFALIPVAKVLIMCGLGFLLATQRIGILSPTGIKLLSKLVFMVFLPCLIFTQLGAAITFQKMLQWWFIPVNVVLASVIGCSIGCIVVLIVRPPPKFKKFTVVMVGIGNIGNIPLVLIDALCRDASNPFGDYDTCSEEGVAYISFGQWVGAVIVYTFVFHMLSPSEASDCGDQRFDIEDHSSLMVNLMNAEEDEGGDGSSTKKTSWWTMKVTLAVKAVKVLKLKEIFQPPVAASILALIVGAIPFLKNLLLTDDAPLYFFSNSLSILGGAMIPCIMLALGGNLVGGSGSSNLGLRTTIAITFTRLFIIPPMGIGVVFLAKKLDFIPADNQLFQFVLLLQHSMPTSILAGGVAALRGVAVKEASAILFWEHIVAIVSISIWLIVYLNFLF